jgi:competence protein ComEC
MNKLAKISLATILFWPRAFQHQPLLNKHLIVWNVGQGQWVTYISNDQCTHFDMGGEKYPRAVEKICKNKTNLVYLSHADWDHISFITRFQRNNTKLCLANTLREKIHGRRKLFLEKLPKCKSINFVPEEISFPSSKLKRANDLSQIFHINSVLIPGDSTKSAEKLWAEKISSDIKILIAGHHGSKTSTGDFLLQNLPKLKQSIASSRKAKYGHPHLEVRMRLKAKKIPLLSTEEWGNIVIDLNN